MSTLAALEANKIKDRLEALIGRSFVYDKKVYKITGFSMDAAKRKFVVDTDFTPFERSFSIADIFFDSLKPVEQNGKIKSASLSKPLQQNRLPVTSRIDAEAFSESVSSHHVASSVIIYQTSDYSRFAMINGNRNINQSKIRRIIKDIDGGNDMLKYYPIQVRENGERLEILDGQHRFLIDQRLQRPVYYILVDEIKSMPDIAKVNSNVEKWKPENYINCYIQQGNQNYVLLKQFMELYDIGATLAVKLLTFGYPSNDNGSDINIEIFHHGSFVVKQQDKAIELMEDCKKFNSFAGWNTRPFIVAVSRIRQAGKIAINDLIISYRKNPEMLTIQASPKNYVWNLEQIVNVNKHKRIVII